MFERIPRLEKNLLLLVLIIAVSFAELVVAHSPHDVIDALVISPAYQKDQTVFVAISDYIRKSTDGGYSWKGVNNGLDNRFSFSDIAISPDYRDDQTLFAATRGDGIYKSEDGGHSWTKNNKGLENLSIGLLSISPEYGSDKLILAASEQGGLFWSDNGGALWVRAVGGQVKVVSLAFFNHAGKSQALMGDAQGNLYLSLNQGRDWQRLEDTQFNSVITTISVSPNVNDDGTVFVGTKDSKIFRSTDGGKTFRRLSSGLTASGSINSIAVFPTYGQDKKVAFSTWYEAVFLSQDGGQSWKKSNSGLSTDSQADSQKHHSPHFHDIVFSENFAKDQVIFIAGFDGLFKSRDGGRSWQQMETLPLGIIKGLGVASTHNEYEAIGVGTYGGGGYVTEDEGKSWTISNVGLKKTRLSDIDFSSDYTSDHTIFAGAYGVLLKSDDKGKSWKRGALELAPWRKWWNKHIAKIGLQFFADLILPPSQFRSPYPTRIAPSPNYSQDRLVFFGTRRHGVMKSSDGGTSAVVIWNGMGEVIADLAMSPDFQHDRTVFASVRGMGVYKSEDGGDNWSAVNHGLDVIDAWKGKVLHGIHINDLFVAISPGYGKDQTLFAASSHGLYKTENGARSWSKIKGLAYGENSYVIALALSPNFAKDNTLLISVKGKGLYKSMDRGNTFTMLSSTLIENNYDVNRILFSPNYDKNHTIYAASYEEVFVSHDDGMSWETISRPVRYENHRAVVIYNGDWRTEKAEEYSAGKVSYSDARGSDVTLNFVGTGVKWIGTRSNEQGKASVYIDGQYMSDIDQYAKASETLVESFVVTNLSRGAHSIRIEAMGEKNLTSQGYRVDIDAFDILP
ncbi:MAG: hypothetical protein ABFS45_04640 [Pseudomonadota bacterium]